MSKKNEKELEKILKSLEDFTNRRKGHTLAVVTYPPTKEEAKGVYVAGDWVHYLKVGETSRTLELIRHKFYKTLKQLEERDKAVVREIEKRKNTKK